MYWMVFLLTLVTAGAVLFQDFRKREVMLLLFPLLGIWGLTLSLFSTTFSQVLINTGINLLILLVQMLLLYGYFWLTKRSFSFFKEKIGLGDILFLIILCFFFSPPNFLLFYTGSLFFSLLLHFLFLRNKGYTASGVSIALAGWQACFLMLLLIIHAFFSVPVYSSPWVENLLFNNASA